MNAEIRDHGLQTALEPHAQGAELPGTVMSVQLAEQHGSDLVEVPLQLEAGQFLTIFQVLQTNIGPVYEAEVLVLSVVDSRADDDLGG